MSSFIKFFTCIQLVIACQSVNNRTIRANNYHNSSKFTKRFSFCCGCYCCWCKSVCLIMYWYMFLIFLLYSAYFTQSSLIRMYIADTQTFLLPFSCFVHFQYVSLSCCWQHINLLNKKNDEFIGLHNSLGIFVEFAWKLVECRGERWRFGIGVDIRFAIAYRVLQTTDNRHHMLGLVCGQLGLQFALASHANHLQAPQAAGQHFSHRTHNMQHCGHSVRIAVYNCEQSNVQVSKYASVVWIYIQKKVFHIIVNMHK